VGRGNSLYELTPGWTGAFIIFFDLLVLFPKMFHPNSIRFDQPDYYSLRAFLTAVVSLPFRVCAGVGPALRVSPTALTLACRLPTRTVFDSLRSMAICGAYTCNSLLPQFPSFLFFHQAPLEKPQRSAPLFPLTRQHLSDACTRHLVLSSKRGWEVIQRFFLKLEKSIVADFEQELDWSMKKLSP